MYLPSQLAICLSVAILVDLVVSFDARTYTYFTCLYIHTFIFLYMNRCIHVDMWYTSTSISPACWPLFSQETVFSALWNLWKHIPKSWTLDQPPLPYTTRFSCPGVGEVDFPPQKVGFECFRLKFFHEISHRPGGLGRCGILGSLTRIAWWESFLGRPQNLIPSNQTIPISRYELICNREPTLLPIMLQWKRTLFRLYGKCPRVNQGDLVGISVFDPQIPPW